MQETEETHVRSLGRFPWSRKWQYTPVFLPVKNSMDRGAWQATAHGVAKSWTWLSIHTPIIVMLMHTHTHVDAYVYYHHCHHTPVSLSQHFPQQISLILVCLFEFILKKPVGVILLNFKAGLIPFYRQSHYDAPLLTEWNLNFSPAILTDWFMSSSLTATSCCISCSL